MTMKPPRPAAEAVTVHGRSWIPSEPQRESSPSGLQTRRTPKMGSASRASRSSTCGTWKLTQGVLTWAGVSGG